jgi:hypothetical protein
MADARIVELDGLLRKLLKEKDGIGASECVSKLSNSELRSLWHQSVIKSRSIDAMWFLWRRFNYRFEAPDSVDLNSQIGDSMLTLPSLLDGFRYINLGACLHLTDASLLGLRNMTTLVDVSLKNCKLLSPNALSNWVDNNGQVVVFHALQSLNLTGTAINDTVAYLVVEAFPNLRQLMLERTKITNKTVSELSRMKRLQVLNLSGCKPVSGEACDSLLKYPKLVKLDLTMTSIKDQEVYDLIEKLEQLSHVNGVTSDRVTGGFELKIKHKRQEDNVTKISRPEFFKSRAISHDDFISGLLACESGTRFYMRDDHRGAPLASWLRSLSFALEPTPFASSSQSKNVENGKIGSSGTETSRNGAKRMDFSLDFKEPPRNPLYDLISAATLASPNKPSRNKHTAQPESEAPTLKAAKQPVAKTSASKPTAKATPAKSPKSNSRRRGEFSPSNDQLSANDTSIGFEALLGAADEMDDLVPSVRVGKHTEKRGTSTRTTDARKTASQQIEKAPVLQMKAKGSKASEATRVRASTTTGARKADGVRRVAKNTRNVEPAPKRPKARRATSDLAETEPDLAPIRKRRAEARRVAEQVRRRPVAVPEPTEPVFGPDLPIARKTRSTATSAAQGADREPPVPHPLYPHLTIPRPGQCVLGPPVTYPRLKRHKSQTNYASDSFELQLSHRAKTAYKFQAKSLTEIHPDLSSDGHTTVTPAHNHNLASARSLTLGGFVVRSRKRTAPAARVVPVPDPSSMDIDVEPAQEHDQDALSPSVEQNGMIFVTYIPPLAIRSNESRRRLRSSSAIRQTNSHNPLRSSRRSTQQVSLRNQSPDTTDSDSDAEITLDYPNGAPESWFSCFKL